METTSAMVAEKTVFGDLFSQISGGGFLGKVNIEDSEKVALSITAEKVNELVEFIRQRSFDASKAEITSLYELALINVTGKKRAILGQLFSSLEKRLSTSQAECETSLLDLFTQSFAPLSKVFAHESFPESLKPVIREKMYSRLQESLERIAFYYVSVAQAIQNDFANHLKQIKEA